MNNSQDQERSGLLWSNKLASANSSPTNDVDPSRSGRDQKPQNKPQNGTRAYSPTPYNPTRTTERPHLPTRSSTFGTPGSDHPPPSHDSLPQSKSEDLNHSSPPPGGFEFSGSSPRAPFVSPRNYSHTPHTMERSTSDDPNRRLSGTSYTSVHSGSSSHSGLPRAPAAVSSNSGNLASATCSACGMPMQGAFVRALGTVFHLGCFKCLDCGDVVASKFFPIEGPDGKQQPLCERDYFRRLNLICAKCGMALRGSYITACNKKFHVEHFTCSLCPTLFGPQDSYYEHEGDVYCHFHYSTRFATKCAGCCSAILKQFVEINRNMRDECWHPECYMINKFWNVKVVSRRPTSVASIEENGNDPPYAEEEARETPVSLKDKQVRMEQQVYRIWTVLSAFEESSAACISDMLRQVSNGQYLDAIRMAEKFILHVEVLFGTIDDLEYHFARLSMKGMSHVREARMLCRKTVDLFTLLSHTQETGMRRMGMTQELLALVTGLAHYLKILIRIALTGALKLERENSVKEAMGSFLDKLHLLAVQGGNPAARRIIKGTNGEALTPNSANNYGTQGVTYGFRSLTPENAGESPFNSTGPRDGSGKISASNPPSDLCIKCNLTVEEDCVRLGTYQRWHSQCIQCMSCGKVAAISVIKEQPKSNGGENKDGKEKETPKLSTARRPPANVNAFVFEADSFKELPSFGDVPSVILCTDHGHQACRSGFQAVSRLEQYAFLLNVALRRLYLLLKKQGVVPLSPDAATANGQPLDANSDLYRNSVDMMRRTTVHLDRKLSATARLPKRSTIVESPAGKSAPPGVIRTQRSQELLSQVSRSLPQPTQLQQGQYPQQGQQPMQGFMPIRHTANGTSQQYPSSTQQPTPRSQQQQATPGMVNIGQQGQLLRPHFARDNTGFMIVDESAPSSPAGGPTEEPVLDNGITLADLPQLMEAAQAREQHRPLPRETSVPYIAEMSNLELAIIKHAAVLALCRSPLKDQFDLEELLEMIESKKGGFWNRLFKPGNDKKNVKKKGVFGVPLELLVEREGADSLLGATGETLRIPSFIDDVISAMRQMDMSVEGIFRKNGNIRRLKDLTETIDRDPSSVDLTTDNPVQLAALLKKFLRDLPDPLLTFKLHKLFIASQSLPNESDRKRLLHMVSLVLPKAHRDTVEVLFAFLKWVASFAHMDEETGSKMDLSNLATVICPSILYSRGRDAVRDESFGAIRVVTALLENQDEFYTVPSEFLPILRDQDYFANSLELTGKDFMKKVDTYMRLRASGRPPTSNGGNGNGAAQRQPPNSSQNLERALPPPSSERVRSPQTGSPPLSTPIQAPPILQSRPQQEDGYGSPRPGNLSSNSRPASFVGSPRINAESPHFSSNEHPPVVRQRT